MLATLVGAPFHRDGWVYEEKYDGFRMLAYKEGGHASLVSRNLLDRTADFPEIAAAVARLPAATLALDGEVVVFDRSQVSRFQLLQRRQVGEGEHRAVFVFFDCLYARGRDLRSEPLRERRAVLEREVGGGALVVPARRLAAEGLAAFAEAKRRGFEGVIGKDEGSRYEAGTRSRAWLKVKVRAEEEFVIGGYTRPRGSRGHFGAILVGAWDDGRLRYAGKVGTGFTERVLADLARRMAPLARPTSPFAERVREPGVTWLEPTLVAQIGFTELTGDGHLRHPVFLGVRDDKPAREVRWPGAPESP